MDITLTVTDGTTTVTLSGGLLKYSPDSGVNVRNGDDEERIRETMRIKIAGASITAARTTARQLTLLFEQARRYDKSKVGARVYATYDPGNTGSAWRAMLFNGSATLDADETLFNTWISKFLILDLDILREPWEGAEVELSLANGSGSGTGGRGISNNDYDTADNWVTIAGSGVLGDMPAKCRIELNHSYNVNPPQKFIWLFHKTDGLTNFAHVIEGESGNGGTNDTDAGSSGSSIKELSWSGTTLTKLWDYTLTENLVNSINHGKVSVVLRIDPIAYTDLYLKFQVRNSTGSTLIKDGSLTPCPTSRTFVDIGNLRIPPGDTGGSNHTLLFEIWAQRLTAGTHNLNLDFVQLSPIAPGNGYRKYTAIDGGLKYQETLVDDGIDGRVYRKLSTNQRVGDFAVEGGPIRLFPGQDQRLILSSMDLSGSYYKAQTYTMRVYYRPRFRVI